MAGSSIYAELTPQWLKSRFLYGVDLTDDNGDPFPDALYVRSLTNAVEWMQSQLGIVIDTITGVEEFHDGEWKDGEAWWPFRLDRRPLQRVTEFAITYGQNEPAVLPVAWVKPVNLTHGQFHLVPTQDNLNNSFIIAGLPYIMGSLFQPRQYVPGYFRVTYDAGFCFQNGDVTALDGETFVDVVFSDSFAFPTTQYGVEVSFNGRQEDQNGAVGLSVSNKTKTGFRINLRTAPAGGVASIHWFASDMPGNMVQAIGLKAALTPLDVAGDLIVGAGIASKSISMDGLSMNINTTSSATNAGYGARVGQYERELKAIMGSLRKRWQIMNVSMV